MLSNGAFSNLVIKEILGKKVYIFDEHHFALPVWALGVDSSSRPLNLVSFDYHTDCVPPFNIYSFRRIYKEGLKSPSKDEFQLADEIRKERLLQINPDELSSLLKAVKDLENDEHITTAHDIGMINEYHIINKKEKNPMNTDEYLYQIESYENDSGENGIILCLEDKYLNQTGFTKPTKPFILDFDLDFFPTRKSFSPRESTIIKELIIESEIITITREKDYFDDLKRENLDVQEAEKLLLDLIFKKLSDN